MVPGRQLRSPLSPRARLQPLRSRQRTLPRAVCGIREHNMATRLSERKSMKQVHRFLKYSASMFLGLALASLSPVSTGAAFAQAMPSELNAYSKVVPLSSEALNRAQTAIAAPDAAVSGSSVQIGRAHV